MRQLFQQVMDKIGIQPGMVVAAVGAEVGYFSVYVAKRVDKYTIRPLLSLKRLFFDETAGGIRYQYSSHGSQEEWMDYLEFIARVTSHIPDKGQVMIRYYGLYSNAHRGKIRKAAAQPSYPLIIEDGPAFVLAKG
jgi:hypothetical protein